jgi:hypothetical protein
LRSRAVTASGAHGSGAVVSSGWALAPRGRSRRWWPLPRPRPRGPSVSGPRRSRSSTSSPKLHRRPPVVARTARVALVE